MLGKLTRGPRVRASELRGRGGGEASQHSPAPILHIINGTWEAGGWGVPVVLGPKVSKWLRQKYTLGNLPEHPSRYLLPVIIFWVGGWGFPTRDVRSG